MFRPPHQGVEEMELAGHFDQALRQLNWIHVQSSGEPSLLPCPALGSHSNACWLRACCELPNRKLNEAQLSNNQLSGPGRAYLNREGRDQIQRLLSAGWTLRSSWPRDWSPSIDQWLGRRLILGHASLLAESTRLISLVSSRMGRHGIQQPDWPHWLDGALRYAHRHKARLLIVPETTLAATVEHFAHLANLPSTPVRWTKHSTPRDWLCDLLSTLGSTSSDLIKQPDAGLITPESLLISPAEDEPSEAFQSLPLQDRLSLALADNVLVLAMRPAGNLENLIDQRLQDPLFPKGSLFVTLAKPVCKSMRSSHAGRTDWLQRGAVGWVTCRTLPTARSPLAHCRSTSQLAHPRPPRRSSDDSVWLDAPQSASTCHHPPIWQMCGPLPAHWRQLEADDDWPYLAHCTRSTQGPFPDESVESFRERVWLRGDAVALHPLETLARICGERRLRGTCGITRTNAACVSFSAVPLVPLLRRRTFQGHLGRWDWEPYGLLMRRNELIDIGASAVIYGSQDDFLRLPAEKQPLFQPRQRKPGKKCETDWTAEREWRVLHDVDLQSLPVGSVCVFTRTAAEARQLAQYTPWPVLWTEPH